MSEHGRQVNAHLIGTLEEGVLAGVVGLLDCNTFASDDKRSRLNWLVNTANLVILLPGWGDSDQYLTELAITRELKIETLFLENIIDRSLNSG